MRILAIETSCDETSLAIVEGDGERFFVVDQVVSSQMATHETYGGVVPEVAARMHVPVLPRLVARMTDWRADGLDGVAVTAGPGLATALRVGVETAKALSVTWGVPLVPVDHMEGHIYANLLSERVPAAQVLFPAVCLIVSGGHTELVLMRGHGQYEYLGQTRDDAAGEAFDKTAAVLGLPYPGGPSVSKAAESGRADAIDFPRPMKQSMDLDFSFSGLKTAVKQVVEATPYAERTPSMVADVCASFEEAVVDVLCHKTARAMEWSQARSVWLCGGVSANRRLRERMQQVAVAQGVLLLVPEMQYTTDNAAMIGAAGLRALLDGRAALDAFVVDADPARVLGGRWKWER